MLSRFLLLLIIVLPVQESLAQVISSIGNNHGSYENRDGNWKAAKWSIIPGGGQIYNRQYWKLPIVYSGLGVVSYALIRNERNQQGLVNNINKLCPDGLGIGDCIIDNSQNASNVLYRNLQLEKRRFDRNKRIAIYSLGSLFVAQIVDAYFSTPKRKIPKGENSARFDMRVFENGVSIGLVITLN